MVSVIYNSIFSSGNRGKPGASSASLIYTNVAIEAGGTGQTYGKHKRMNSRWMHSASVRAHGAMLLQTNYVMLMTNVITRFIDHPPSSTFRITRKHDIFSTLFWQQTFL